MSVHEHSSDLAALTSAANEFEAGTLVAVLREAGIEAVAFDRAQILGMTDIPGSRVPIHVRTDDLERAREALRQNVSDSVDLDWSDVDVGEPEENLPIAHPHESRAGRRPMPLIVRVGFLLAMASLGIGVLALLRSIFTFWW